MPFHHSEIIVQVSRQEMEIFASKLPHFLPISGALGWNIGKVPYVMEWIEA